MTNILKVQPELLDVLASHQHNAAASASSGVAATAGLAESVAISHGSYCKQFNDTLKMYESAHNAFGSSLHAAGIALAKNLRTAARAYLDADETWRQAIESLTF